MVLRRALRFSLRAAGQAARHLPVEARRRLADRRLRPRRRVGARHRRDPQRRAPADWLSLPLCLRHADRDRRPGYLDDAGERLMTDWPILTTVTFLPLVGVVLILLVRDDGEAARRNIKMIALATTVFTFLVSIFVWTGFDAGDPGFQMVEKAAWLDRGTTYHVGVDGISMLFVILTTFLMPFCILASWESVEKRIKEYMISFLLLETLMIGVFCALDLVLFY